MSHANNEKTTDKATADATSAFCADYLGDLDTSTVVEAGVWEKGSPTTGGTLGRILLRPVMPGRERHSPA